MNEHKYPPEVVKAINKQIPKAPTVSSSRLFYVCPSCRSLLERQEETTYGCVDIPYCKWCGQKLDWR
jgi:NAD-dependent DNA ligase